MDTALPSFATVESALRRTTEVLAQELARPTETVPGWNGLEWRMAVAVAALHGIAPLLSTTLRWRGPSLWTRFLSEQRLHALRRHERIANAIAQIDALASRSGICMTAMKGAALHELGLYLPGERPMADIDLLVRPEQLAASVELLELVGYAQAPLTGRDRTFVPLDAPQAARFGEHSSNAVKIELKSRVSQPLPFFETDITDLLLPSPTRPGIGFYPSLAVLMAHLLLHASGDIRTRSLRSIQLHDIALLARRLDSTDWESLLTLIETGRFRWAFPPLALASRYDPTAIPPPMLERTRLVCPRTLCRISSRQTLTDVSASNLWIQAFPGIEWSQSLLEAALYLRSRTFPSRHQRIDRNLIAATQSWAAQSPWIRASHLRRSVQWLLSPAPRVDTLSSVRAAWEYAV